MSRRPPSVAELNGFAFRPPPIPPDYHAPPSGGVVVQTIEPVDGYWTMAGKFGFRFEGLLPGLAEVIPLVQNQRLPGPPAPVWLAFFRFDRGVNTSGEVGLPNSDIRGRVTYGAGGAQNVFDVDIISGVQFPIVCNSVQVDLVTYAPESGPYAAQTLIAGVTVGKGAAGTGLPPTYTTEIFESFDESGTQATDYLVAVPDFARSVVLFTSISDVADPLQLGSWKVDFIANSLSVIKRVTAVDAWNALTQEKGIPIPAATAQIRVTGASGNVVARSGLQFFLAL